MEKQDKPKLLIISLCTTGVMKEHFIYYAKHISKHFNLFCVTNDNICNEELNAIKTLNVRYKRSEKTGYFSLKKLYSIKKFVKDVNPDLVYVFTPHPVNILLSSFLKKYRLAFQVHDPIPHIGTPILDRIIQKIQLWQYYRRSTLLVVAGDELKDVIRTKYPQYEDKISVVKFALLDNQIFDLGSQTKTNDILFFGRIEKYKGIGILIEALSLLNYKYSCVIAGRGDFKKACGISFDGSGTNTTLMNRYVSDYDLALLIAKSKVVVLPYLDATGSTTIALSFYYGAIVVASNVGTFPEYVGDAGVILKENTPKELAITLERLLDDKQKLADLSTRAKNRASIFDIELVMNELASCLMRAIKDADSSIKEN